MMYSNFISDKKGIPDNMLQKMSIGQYHAEKSKTVVAPSK